MTPQMIIGGIVLLAVWIGVSWFMAGKGGVDGCHG